MLLSNRCDDNSGPPPGTATASCSAAALLPPTPISEGKVHPLLLDLESVTIDSALSNLAVQKHFTQDKDPHM